jgi:hypothetical protein
MSQVPWTIVWVLYLLLQNRMSNQQWEVHSGCCSWFRCQFFFTQESTVDSWYVCGREFVWRVTRPFAYPATDGGTLIAPPHWLFVALVWDQVLVSRGQDGGNDILTLLGRPCHPLQYSRLGFRRQRLEKSQPVWAGGRKIFTSYRVATRYVRHAWYCDHRPVVGSTLAWSLQCCSVLHRLSTKQCPNLRAFKIPMFFFGGRPISMLLFHVRSCVT